MTWRYPNPKGQDCEMWEVFLWPLCHKIASAQFYLQENPPRPAVAYDELAEVREQLKQVMVGEKYLPEGLIDHYIYAIQRMEAEAGRPISPYRLVDYRLVDYDQYRQKIHGVILKWLGEEKGGDWDKVFQAFIEKRMLSDTPRGESE